MGYSSLMKTFLVVLALVASTAAPLQATGFHFRPGAALDVSRIAWTPTKETDMSKSTSAAEYRALIKASTSKDATIPADLGPDLADKGLAEDRGDGTYRVTPEGMDHVGY